METHTQTHTHWHTVMHNFAHTHLRAYTQTNHLVAPLYKTPNLAPGKEADISQHSVSFICHSHTHTHTHTMNGWQNTHAHMVKHSDTTHTDTHTKTHFRSPAVVQPEPHMFNDNASSLQRCRAGRWNRWKRNTTKEKKDNREWKTIANIKDSIQPSLSLSGNTVLREAREEVK